MFERAGLLSSLATQRLNSYFIHADVRSNQPIDCICQYLHFLQAILSNVCSKCDSHPLSINLTSHYE